MPCAIYVFFVSSLNRLVSYISSTFSIFIVCFFHLLRLQEGVVSSSRFHLGLILHRLLPQETSDHLLHPSNLLAPGRKRENEAISKRQWRWCFYLELGMEGFCPIPPVWVPKYGFLARWMSAAIFTGRRSRGSALGKSTYSQILLHHHHPQITQIL